MKSTTDLLNIIKNSKDEALKQTIDTIKEMSFSEYFNYLCRIKEVSRSDIIKQTNLSRTYAYQIFDGSKKAGRDKIIQIALALKSSLKETERLLKLSGHSPLYSKIRRDAVLIFAIEHQLTAIAANELLDDFQFECLE
ncbi:MAG: hypothetical protein ACLROI_02460 [Beduini sp.]|uniref:hypothetical protein n=1 Tax=Beduini sp. TaxID=1922300 RepID=UPI0011CA7930